LYFTYAAFSNDFTHYSVYNETEGKEGEPGYSKREYISKSGQANLIFEDREKYISQ
jgi:hypothetical protein